MRLHRRKKKGDMKTKIYCCYAMMSNHPVARWFLTEAERDAAMRKPADVAFEIELAGFLRMRHQVQSIVDRVARRIERREFVHQPDLKTLPQCHVVQELVEAAYNALAALDGPLRDHLEGSLWQFDSYAVPTAFSIDDVDDSGERGITTGESRMALFDFVRNHETSESDWARLHNCGDRVLKERVVCFKVVRAEKGEVLLPANLVREFAQKNSLMGMDIEPALLGALREFTKDPSASVVTCEMDLRYNAAGELIEEPGNLAPEDADAPLDIQRMQFLAKGFPMKAFEISYAFISKWENAPKTEDFKVSPVVLWGVESTPKGQTLLFSSNGPLRTGPQDCRLPMIDDAGEFFLTEEDAAKRVAYRKEQEALLSGGGN